MGALVISIMGDNMKSLQERLKTGCKSLNYARPSEQLEDIVLFTPKKSDKYDCLQLKQRLHCDRTSDVFLINEVHTVCIVLFFLFQQNYQKTLKIKQYIQFCLNNTVSENY